MLVETFGCAHWSDYIADPNHGGKHLWEVRVGKLSLCSQATATPWHPSHAGAGDASRLVVTVTVKFRGC